MERNGRQWNCLNGARSDQPQQRRTCIKAATSCRFYYVVRFNININGLSCVLGMYTLSYRDSFGPLQTQIGCWRRRRWRRQSQSGPCSGRGKSGESGGTGGEVASLHMSDIIYSTRLDSTWLDATECYSSCSRDDSRGANRQVGAERTEPDRTDRKQSQQQGNR